MGNGNAKDKYAKEKIEQKILGGIKMILEEFMKKRKKQEEKKKTGNESGIGKRYAMQYKRLSIPIAEKDYRSTVFALIKCNADDLDMNDISNLWTVIEYIGEGKYVDLITGEIYTDQILVDDILDTVTQEYEMEALEMKARLMQSPLAVGSFSYVYGTVPLREVDTEMKQRILNESMPRKEEIKEQVQSMKKEAQERINLFYQGYNENKMAEIKKQAERENREFDRQKAQERWEQEQKRKEKERLEREAKLREIVDPEFDSIFPKDASAKVLRKK